MAKCHVVWPHELVYIGASRNTAVYDQLTPVQFITGFLRSLQMAPPNDRDNLLTYGIDLFQDAVDVSWEVARGANSVVLQEIEQGRLNWGDLDKIQRTRSLYTQHANVSSSNVNFTRGDSQYSADDASVARKQVCRYYNFNKCTHEGDHQTATGKLFRHVCSYCYKTLKKSLVHPEARCSAKKNN